MKIISFFLIISIYTLYSNEEIINEVKEISCNDEINLILDEENMTESEILAAKELYFNQLLAQQNQNCISINMGSSKLVTTNISKGGKVAGNEVANIKENTSSGETLATPSITSASPSTRLTQDLKSGSVKCLEKYENDDEFSIQLKEAISKTTDEELKQELILEYAKYNNIKPETLKC
jgi:hypothetical protein